MQDKDKEGPPPLLPPSGDEAACAPSTSKETPKPEPFLAEAAPKHSAFMDWFSTKLKKKKDKTPKETKEVRKQKSQSLASMKVADEERKEFVKYLHKNPDFLDAYVTEHISMDTLEKWMEKKLYQQEIPKHDEDDEPLTEDSVEKQKFLKLINHLKEEPAEYSVLWKLANDIKTTVEAESFRIYKVHPDYHYYVQYIELDEKHPARQSGFSRVSPEDAVHIVKVAKEGVCLKMSFDAFDDFQMAIKDANIENWSDEKHVLYVPVLSKSGKTCYVLEMWRKFAFTDAEVNRCSIYLVWGSLSLHYCNKFLDKAKERNMSHFLLDVVKAIFEEMVSLDQLIKSILEFAQKLVNADRASLFLIDFKNNELVSTVFDLKYEGDENDIEKKEIRMPMDKGIAGHVARSGETMNIPDAYAEPKFNREVDETTGYKTDSILCMPIKAEGRVIGVVQMVNKREDQIFDHDDETSFEIFSTFFGLALHHARLYDRIMRKEQKYRVALEVLSYHNTCKEYDVQALLSQRRESAVSLNDFYLDPFKFDEFEKCKSAVTMFDDLFGLSNFDAATVTRFILTVKKNYRTVPYHNFDHGWSVAHAMYVILKNDHKRFNYNMRLALFVGSLCHDLDHRGYTNQYTNDIASPLAAMYSTSTLEHHHFNITVTILQQDGHNIFSHISSESYKEILGFIRHCILATDLAMFFPNLEKMKGFFEGKIVQKFNWLQPAHRDLAMAISMTAADLSASAKPWDVQIRTVKIIFEEFYEQGDKERAAGKIPIPMMDRNMPEEQPSSQVGFLKTICVPCYHMLNKILPSTKPMLIMATKNLDRWQMKAERIMQRMKRRKAKAARRRPGSELKTTTSDDSSANDRRQSNVYEHRDSISWEEEEAAIIDEVKVKQMIKEDDEASGWIEDDEGEADFFYHLQDEDDSNMRSLFWIL